jgi:hypothetical protein
VYYYVNRPYEAVRTTLSADALSVFRNATKAAAHRANTLASELRVNIAGIEVGTDININVRSVETLEPTASMPNRTRIVLEWEAAKMPRMFPFMQAELLVYPLTATETQLDLQGNYDPPLGLVGSVLDAAVGHRIAEASVQQFIKNVAAFLRSE